MFKIIAFTAISASAVLGSFVGFPRSADCQLGSGAGYYERTALQDKVLELTGSSSDSCDGNSCKVEWKPVHANPNLFIEYTKKSDGAGGQVFTYVHTYKDTGVRHLLRRYAIVADLSGEQRFGPVQGDQIE